MNIFMIEDIVKHILSFINPRESRNFANTCKLWNKIHKENIKIICHGEIKKCEDESYAGKIVRQYGIFPYFISESMRQLGGIFDTNYIYYIAISNHSDLSKYNIYNTTCINNRSPTFYGCTMYYDRDDIEGIYNIKFESNHYIIDKSIADIFLGK